MSDRDLERDARTAVESDAQEAVGLAHVAALLRLLDEARTVRREAVLRVPDGSRPQIPASRLVRGDVVILSGGAPAVVTKVERRADGRVRVDARTASAIVAWTCQADELVEVSRPEPEEYAKVRGDDR